MYRISQLIRSRSLLLHLTYETRDALSKPFSDQAKDLQVQNPPHPHTIVYLAYNGEACWFIRVDADIGLALTLIFRCISLPTVGQFKVSSVTQDALTT